MSEKAEVRLLVGCGRLQGVRLLDVGDVNILIGPNNAGKTTVLKAIHGALVGGWWETDLTRFQTHVSGARRICSSSSPFMMVDGKGNGIKTEDLRRSLVRQRLTGVVSYLDGIEDHLSRTLPSSESLFLSHRRKSPYTEPRTRSDRLDEDASNLASRLHRIRGRYTKLAAKIDLFMKDVIPGCPPVSADYAGVTDATPDHLEILIGERSLREVGGGVEQALAIAVALIAEPYYKTLLIEEPETNLHPKSQRELIRKILKWRTDQVVFISTHSPAILNEIYSSDAGNVYRISPDISKGDIEPCRVNTDARRALAEIGARASDLLQVNCALWVEGPSEVIVWRHLLSLFGGINEHRDFEFMFSSGSLSKWLDGDVGGASSSIDVFRICGSNIAILDRDAPPDKEPRKPYREISGADLCYTWGWELEWYYPQDIVGDMYSELRVGEMFGADIYGKMPFFEALKQSGVEGEKKKSKVALEVVDKMNKMTPERAWELWTTGVQGGHLRELVESIASGINQANS